MLPILRTNAQPAIKQAMALLPPQMDRPEAWVMLYAIGLQESRFTARRQIVNGQPTGPAAGFWQFEQGGGCRGVIQHNASRYWMSLLCQARRVEVTPQGLWRALERDDVLAAGAARLLLFTDPKRLPEIGETEQAWDLYTRVWRPGKPHRHTWDEMYDAAVNAVTTEA